MQLDLAFLASSPTSTPFGPDGWYRAAGGTSGFYEHRSGWEIRHCGHMTANWPYHLVDPAFPDVPTMTFNGLGFRTLAEAKEAVARVLAGQLVATASRCVAGVRRVTTPADDYETDAAAA